MFTISKVIIGQFCVYSLFLLPPSGKNNTMQDFINLPVRWTQLCQTLQHGISTFWVFSLYVHRTSHGKCVFFGINEKNCDRGIFKFVKQPDSKSSTIETKTINSLNTDFHALKIYICVRPVGKPRTWRRSSPLWSRSSGG